MTRSASFFNPKSRERNSKSHFPPSRRAFHGNCALDPIFTNDLHRDEEEKTFNTQSEHIFIPSQHNFPTTVDATVVRRVCVGVSIRVSFLRFSHEKKLALKGFGKKSSFLLGMPQNCTYLACSRNRNRHEPNYAYPEHQVHQNDEEFDDRTARIHCDTFFCFVSRQPSLV